MTSKFRTTVLKALCASSLCALASPLTVEGDQRPDLSARRAVYFASSPAAFKTTDKRVDAGATVTVAKSQATSCTGDKCTFNLGVIAYRSGSTKQLTAYGQFTGQTVGIVGNSIVFQSNSNSRQHVLPVNLSIGKNIVAFTIDPENKIAETDEKNNTFSVTIIVE